jgi:hypothetical protein
MYLLCGMISLIFLGIAIVAFFKPSLIKENGDKKRLMAAAITLSMVFFILFTILEPEDPEVAAKETVEKESKMNQKELITKRVNAELGDRGNLKEIKLYKDKEDDKDYVMLEIRYSLPRKSFFSKKTIEYKMEDIFYSIYKDMRNINAISITVLIPVIDKYGNEGEEEGYSTTLMIGEVEKINWKQDPETIKLMVIPRLWLAETNDNLLTEQQ